MGIFLLSTREGAVRPDAIVGRPVADGVAASQARPESPHADRDVARAPCIDGDRRAMGRALDVRRRRRVFLPRVAGQWRRAIRDGCEGVLPYLRCWFVGQPRPLAQEARSSMALDAITCEVSAVP